MSTNQEVVKAVVRQTALTAVMVTALIQGYNGHLVMVYFASSLAMAGVDAPDILRSKQ